MKKYSTTLLLSLFLTLISLSVFAQKNNERRSVLDQQYEVQYIGVGQDGTKVFTVMTTAKKV